jgi:hypothetical protein
MWAPPRCLSPRSLSFSFSQPPFPPLQPSPPSPPLQMSLSQLSSSLSLARPPARAYSLTEVSLSPRCLSVCLSVCLLSVRFTKEHKHADEFSQAHTDVHSLICMRACLFAYSYTYTHLHIYQVMHTGGIGRLLPLTSCFYAIEYVHLCFHVYTFHRSISFHVLRMHTFRTLHPSTSLDAHFFVYFGHMV